MLDLMKESNFRRPDPASWCPPHFTPLRYQKSKPFSRS